MASVAKPPENLHARAAETPGEWRLILSPKPSAVTVLYLTLYPQGADNVTVKKYSTRFGWNYEEHIQSNGVSTWYKLVKIRST